MPVQAFSRSPLPFRVVSAVNVSPRSLFCARSPSALLRSFPDRRAHSRPSRQRLRRSSGARATAVSASRPPAPHGRLRSWRGPARASAHACAAATATRAWPRAPAEAAPHPRRAGGRARSASRPPPTRSRQTPAPGPAARRPCGPARRQQPLQLPGRHPARQIQELLAGLLVGDAHGLARLPRSRPRTATTANPHTTWRRSSSPTPRGGRTRRAARATGSARRRYAPRATPTPRPARSPRAKPDFDPGVVSCLI